MNIAKALALFAAIFVIEASHSVNADQTAELTQNAWRCEALLNAPPPISPEVAQWLSWELTPTIGGWEQERATSLVPIADVDEKSLRVERLGKADTRRIETELSSRMGRVAWYKHPYNRDPRVPHLDAPVRDFRIAYHTASRGVVTVINSGLLGIKMPTDHPFASQRGHHPVKVEMDMDLKYSVPRSQAIKRIDDKIGHDPNVIILNEIAAVIDKQTGNGFLYRDLSPLQDGHHYFPAHLVPYAGREIAIKHGEDPILFWRKHWAEALGRFQAKLLYRYGIQVRAVNPQNFLIQLDKNFMPTGAIVWRDIAESHLVDLIARNIGLESFVERDLRNGGWGVISKSVYRSGELYWLFDKAPIPLKEQEGWDWDYAQHEAYIDELAVTLGIPARHMHAGGGGIYAYLNAQFLNINSELITRILRWHKLQTQRLRGSFD